MSSTVSYNWRHLNNCLDGDTFKRHFLVFSCRIVRQGEENNVFYVLLITAEYSTSFTLVSPINSDSSSSLKKMYSHYLNESITFQG